MIIPIGFMVPPEAAITETITSQISFTEITEADLVTNETISTQVAFSETITELDFVSDTLQITGLTSAPITETVSMQLLLTGETQETETPPTKTTFTLNQTVTQQQVDREVASLSFTQRIIDWNPIAIVKHQLSLNLEQGEEGTRAVFHDPICLNSRSKALGPIPPNHPGA